MKQIKARKLLAWMLSVSMVASAMFTGTAPGVSAAEGTDQETTNYARTINLGTKGISRPMVPTGSGQGWRGDYVWFGWEDKFKFAIGCRVLDPSTTEYSTDESTMLLETGTVIGNMSLHSEGIADWTEARTYLNGEFMDLHFSAGEKNAIAKSSKARESEQDGKGFVGLRFVPFSDVSIFLLDAKEVTRPSYGYNNNNNKAVARSKIIRESGELRSWWLRSDCNVEYVDSEGKNCYQGGVVREDGSISCIADHPKEEDLTHGVSAAFNVRSSSVVFTSADEGRESSDFLDGKPDDVISGEKTLTEVRDYDTVDNIGHTWKLTLKSGDAAPKISEIERNNNKISFDYSGVRIGDKQTLSAIITSGEGDEEIVLHYGILAETDKAGSQSGTVTFTLPAGFDAKKHKLKVFSEQRNGVARTDYAGDMAVVDVPDAPVVTDPPVVTDTPTPVPTETPVVKPAETDNPDPTGTPVETLKPTKRPGVETDVVTTAKPTETPEGSGTPTPKPKESEKPVESSTPVPNTEKPTERPEKTEQPSVEPTREPKETEKPTVKPEETNKPDTKVEPTTQPELTKTPPPANVIEDSDTDEEEDDYEESGSDQTKTETSSKTKDREPKTGEESKVEMYATIAMVAGLSYLLLYFMDEESGMTEERKKELVSKLVRWAKKGGRFRNMLAAAAIVLLLVYYHAIGKRSILEKNACQDRT